jgi:hypothetical protein
MSPVKQQSPPRNQAKSPVKSPEPIHPPSVYEDELNQADIRNYIDDYGEEEDDKEPSFSADVDGKY